MRFNVKKRTNASHSHGLMRNQILAPDLAGQLSGPIACQYIALKNRSSNYYILHSALDPDLPCQQNMIDRPQGVSKNRQESFHRHARHLRKMWHGALRANNRIHHLTRVNNPLQSTAVALEIRTTNVRIIVVAHSATTRTSTS